MLEHSLTHNAGSYRCISATELVIGSAHTLSADIRFVLATRRVIRVLMYVSEADAHELHTVL